MPASALALARVIGAEANGFRDVLQIDEAQARDVRRRAIRALGEAAGGIRLRRSRWKS